MSIFGQICTKITKFTPDLGMRSLHRSAPTGRARCIARRICRGQAYSYLQGLEQQSFMHARISVIQIHAGSVIHRYRQRSFMLNLLFPSFHSIWEFGESDMRAPQLPSPGFSRRNAEPADPSQPPESAKT